MGSCHSSVSNTNNKVKNKLSLKSPFSRKKFGSNRFGTDRSDTYTPASEAFNHLKRSSASFEYEKQAISSPKQVKGGNNCNNLSRSSLNINPSSNNKAKKKRASKIKSTNQKALNKANDQKPACCDTRQDKEQLLLIENREIAQNIDSLGQLASAQHVDYEIENYFSRTSAASRRVKTSKTTAIVASISYPLPSGSSTQESICHSNQSHNSPYCRKYIDSSNISSSRSNTLDSKNEDNEFIGYSSKLNSSIDCDYESTESSLVRELEITADNKQCQKTFISTDNKLFRLQRDCSLSNNPTNLTHLIRPSKSIECKLIEKDIRFKHRMMSTSSKTTTTVSSLTSTDSVMVDQSHISTGASTGSASSTNHVASTPKTAASSLPAGSLVNRFGFKSAISQPKTTAMKAQNQNSPQQQLPYSSSQLPTAPLTTTQLKKINLSLTNSANITVTPPKTPDNQESPIKTAKKSQNNLAVDLNDATNRSKSPPRSFIKPPSISMVNSQSSLNTNANSNQKSNQGSASDFHVKNVKHNHSSSLSSLSSTSSSHSNQYGKSPIVKNAEKSSSNAYVASSSLKAMTPADNKSKHHLTPTPAAKKSATSPNSSSQNVSSKAAQQKQQANDVTGEASKKQTTHPQLSPLPTSQHKRRLFSPYKLNISPNQQSSVKPAEALNNSINSQNGSTVSEVSSTSVPKAASSPSPNGSVKSNTSGSTNPQQLQYKLLSKLSGFKNQIQPSAKRDSESPLKELKNSDEHLEIKSKSGISPLRPKTEDGNRNDLMKREDSAYCSSTSSTVSSHDVDPNKLITDKSTEDLTRHDEFESKKQNGKEPSAADQESNSKSVPVTKSNTGNDADDDDFNQEDYCEDTMNMMDNLKQTLLNLDHSNGDLDEEEPGQLNKSISKLKHNSNNQNIQDSIGELNQLMISSSISTATIDGSSDTPATPNLVHGKQRRTSTSSLNQSASSVNGMPQPPMFKPPSNLPPCENCEVIQIDIETYRLLIQDLQNTKTILYKLASILKEPSSGGHHPTTPALNSESNVFDYQPDDLQNMMISNPLVSSLYSHQNSTINSNNEKFDQSTQTDD